MDPKKLEKKLYIELRRVLGEVFQELASHKEARMLEGHLMVDHVHILIEIPSKYSVAQVIGYIKGKSAIHIARRFEGRQKDFTGEHFWARGYYVSTVGLDEKMIQEYIKNQEDEDRRQDQLGVVWPNRPPLRGWHLVILL